jgi:hypothetical protein
MSVWTYSGVVWEMFTDVSEENDASVFVIEVYSFSEKLKISQATRRHIPGDNTVIVVT